MSLLQAWAILWSVSVPALTAGIHAESAAPAPPPCAQVVFRMQLVEISRTKCRQAGFDLAIAGVNGNQPVGSLVGILHAAPTAPYIDKRLMGAGGNVICLAPDDPRMAVTGLLDFLVKNQFARVLAAPTIVTAVGRPVRFHMGGELPPGKFAGGNGPESASLREFGTTVELSEVQYVDHAVHADLEFRVAELPPTAPVAAATPQSLRVREIDAPVEIPDGHTLFLSGLVVQSLPEASFGETSCASSADESELLLIVKAEAVR